MKVFVLGGTGFLGFHAVNELLRRGHEVTVLALDLPKDDLLPPQVKYRIADIGKCGDDEIAKALEGQDALVFAIGADDRVVPPAPAYEFFYNANVLTTRRLFSIASKTGVKKGVVTGSYFAYFDRIWPEMKLAAHHPYIRVRREQSQAAFDAGAGMAVQVLELPYIFGRMPGRVPLWAPLLKYVLSPFPLFYTPGGTTMVSVQQVAEAIAGAVETDSPSGCRPVGDVNMTWAEMLQLFLQIAGKRKRVITMPPAFAAMSMRFVEMKFRKAGKEHGLNPVEFIKLQCVNTYIKTEDLAESRVALGFGSGGIEQAFRDTLAACGLLK